MTSKRLFISYSRADSTFVEKLTSELRENGQDVWVDNKIRSGQTWDQTVEQNIKNCEVLVVVMSKTSVASSNVMDEVSFAIGLNKTIAPILIEDCEVPMRLARYQYVDFDQLGLKKGTEKLVSDITFDTEQVGGDDLQKADSVGSDSSESKTGRSKKNLIIAGAVIIGLIAVLVGTDVINLEDTSDDFPENIVESALTDEASWSNASAINSAKSYLDYLAKYPEDGKYLKQANKQLSSLFNAEGVVQYSEGSGTDKENDFEIYHGGTEDKSDTPKEGQYIISLKDNNVNTKLLGENSSSGHTLKVNAVVKVLEIITAESKVWCKVAYQQN